MFLVVEEGAHGAHDAAQAGEKRVVGVAGLDEGGAQGGHHCLCQPKQKLFY